MSAIDMTMMSRDFLASAGTGSLSDVPPGANRTIAFEGLDANGNAQYRGQVTGVTLKSGQVFDCGTVAMDPVPAVTNLVIFESDRNGTWQLFKMNPDGTGQTPITSDTYNNRNACASPEGGKIAFRTDRNSSFCDSGYCDLYVINVDGSGLTQLTNASVRNVYDLGTCVWSKDGKKVFFSGKSVSSGGNREVWSAQADGTGQQLLLSQAGRDLSPMSISADGSRISLNDSQTGADGVDNVQSTVKTDGTGYSYASLVKEPRDGRDDDGRWSPDGALFVYLKGRGSGSPAQIYVENGSANNYPGTNLTRDSLENGGPSWSADGSKILYFAPKDGFNHIWSFNLALNEKMPLSAGEYSDMNPVWLVMATPGSATTDIWKTTSTAGAPSARSRHGAVWTGSEMIVWGGWDLSWGFNTGGRYDPVIDVWKPVLGSPPPARYDMAMVWTGTEVIIWGGYCVNLSTTCDGGGRYNPTTDSWTGVATIGAASPRYGLVSVWTGSHMLVWGGVYSSLSPTVVPPILVSSVTGSRYDPAANLWTAISTTNAPPSTYNASAVWTGTEMIVWGGSLNSTTTTSAGGRYNPATDLWTAASTTNAPASRARHTAVWTGTEMLVWGGQGDDGMPQTAGGRYDPATDIWTSMSATNQPVPRTDMLYSSWTGSEMIVWGGYDGSAVLNTGGKYNPAIDSWIPTSTLNAPAAVRGMTNVWTGSQMIIWGGDNAASVVNNSGGRYTP
ncbi:MAG: hypothetical protein OEW15_12605 [Nitrospirota bacterium]|nr:hypothetical protein [Nitrospirota bacterium]